MPVFADGIYVFLAKYRVILKLGWFAIRRRVALPKRILTAT